MHQLLLGRVKDFNPIRFSASTTTVKTIAGEIDIDKTLLGVDAVSNETIVAQDIRSCCKITQVSTRQGKNRRDEKHWFVTMPGSLSKPAAYRIDLSDEGEVLGICTHDE